MRAGRAALRLMPVPLYSGLPAAAQLAAFQAAPRGYRKVRCVPGCFLGFSRVHNKPFYAGLPARRAAGRVPGRAPGLPQGAFVACLPLPRFDAHSPLNENLTKDVSFCLHVGALPHGGSSALSVMLRGAGTPA